MTRALDSALLASIALQTGGEGCWLLEFEFGSGTVRYTSAARDLVVGADTYTALGGVLNLSPVADSTDDAAQGVDITLGPVEQTFLNLVLAESYAGRLARIAFAHYSQNDGAIVGAAYDAFVGYMNEAWRVLERRPEEGGGTLTISTRLTSRLAGLRQRRGMVCTEDSHRATVPAAAAIVGGDRFFAGTARLALQRIYWGMDDPGAPPKAMFPRVTPFGVS